MIFAVGKLRPERRIVDSEPKLPVRVRVLPMAVRTQMAASVSRSSKAAVPLSAQS
ncbi:MAG TPA: hypothetical protein VIE66_01845 [Methylocella sp.]|jgi:hypothetical protein